MAFFSFNGVTKDYVRVLRGLERPAWAPIEHEILEIPGRPGGLISGKKIKVRQINIPVRVYTKGFESLQKAKEDLAAWLITDEPKELIFSDEPDRVYYAQVTGELNLDELVEWGEGVISFICPDPYKYGPLRTQTINVPPASFSRNSVAYKSDGTQVSANQPRFEQGGVMVEEGTVNLIPSALAKNLTSAWTSGNLNGTYTLSVRGGTGQVNISGGYTGSAAVGQTLTFSVANKTITLTPANGTPQFVQLEQKPYATSFVDGTRQPEALTLPTDGVLNPEEGTIECLVNVNDVLKRVDGTFRVLWYALPVGGATNGWFILDHDGSASRWRITTGNLAGYKSYFVPDSYTPNGWHLFSITYNQKSKSIKFFIDGVLRLSVSDAFLPSSYRNFFIGLAQENARWANAIFGPLRISRIARSDAEILDAYQNGFTVDEYTTAYLDFENNLEVQTPTIVNNEGTAETYPTFTAYVKQPITFLDIISPDSYMRVGQPYEVSQTPVDGEVRVLIDNMSTLTGWGPASAIDNGVIQGSFHAVSETFRVQDYGPAYNGWAGPALKKSLPNPIQDFLVWSLIDITSSANGVGRIEIYGLDTANNFVFRMGIGDFSAKSKDVKAYWELGPSTDSIFSTYGKKMGALNDYYGILVIQRKGNKWTVYTAKRTSSVPVVNYVDYVQSTYVDTKNKYTGQLAQIQIHIGTHLGYGPISHMSINHIEVFELRDTAADQVPYIAYPDDVLQFDHKNAVIYRNGEPIMWAKDFGASFFALKPGTTELSVNPSDAAVVTIDYRPRYK